MATIGISAAQIPRGANGNQARVPRGWRWKEAAREGWIHPGEELVDQQLSADPGPAAGVGLQEQREALKAVQAPSLENVVKAVVVCSPLSSFILHGVSALFASIFLMLVEFLQKCGCVLPTFLDSFSLFQPAGAGDDAIV